MRMKWITGSVFLAGLLALATVDSQGQPPGGFGGRERGGDRERGGPGRGGFRMDPDAMWDRMAQGQDSINLNDPRFAGMRRMAERSGEPLPPNGILTKQQFVANMQRRMEQRSSDGGGPGRYTPPSGSAPPMTFQATPGSNGRPVFMTQGGPPGMGMPGGTPGMSDEMVQRIVRMSDRNQDGRIDRDEARGGMRDRFEQYDANRDGGIDANEFRSYMQERMSSRGPGSSSDPRNGSSQLPGGWSGPQGGRDSRGKDRDAEERPVVYRYGNLPKELPGWWSELDTDQDGQVGLYEWRRQSKPTAEFVGFDLNADGYLTAGEWLRHQALASERRASESGSEAGSVGLGGRGSPGQNGGGMRLQLQPGGSGGDRTRFQPRGEWTGKGGGNDRTTGDQEKGNGDRPRKKSRNPSNGD